MGAWNAEGAAVQGVGAGWSEFGAGGVRGWRADGDESEWVEEG